MWNSVKNGLMFFGKHVAIGAAAAVGAASAAAVLGGIGAGAKKASDKINESRNKRPRPPSTHNSTVEAAA